jgi:hypothetical protein
MDTIYDAIMKTVETAYSDGVYLAESGQEPLNPADIQNRYGDHGSESANNLIWFSYWIGYLVGLVFLGTASTNDKYSEMWEGKKALIEAVNWGLSNGYYGKQVSYQPDMKWQTDATVAMKDDDIGWNLGNAFHHAFALGEKLAKVPSVDTPVGIPTPVVSEKKSSSVGWWILGILGLAAVVTSTGFALSGNTNQNPVGSFPKDLTRMTKAQQQNAVDQLAAKPLKELRRRQSITESQIKQAYAVGDNESLRNLYVMQRVLDQAVHKREFGG